MRRFKRHITTVGAESYENSTHRLAVKNKWMNEW